MKNVKNIIFLVLITIVTIVCSRVAGAVEFTVNSYNDAVDTNLGDGVCAIEEGYCTLRAAVQEANDTDEIDTIVLPSGTYTLDIAGDDYSDQSVDDLVIYNDLIIRGDGADTTIINAVGIRRILHVKAAADVIIEKVMLSGGDAGSEVGNVNYGTLTIKNCIVSNNKAYTGAGLSNSGTLKIENSEISYNEATNYIGGGIYSDGVLIISDSIITGNIADDDGGGIAINAATQGYYNDGMTLSIINSIISENRASSSGGGIAIDYIISNEAYTDNPISVIESIISNNSAGFVGGGMYIRGNTFIDGNYDHLNSDVSMPVDVDIVDSIIENNTSEGQGAGLAVGTISLTDAKVRLVNSTLVKNEGNIGGTGTKTSGGIFNYGVLDIINCTISENVTSGFFGGSAIYNYANMDIKNSTITNNKNDSDWAGSGIYHHGNKLNLYNSIVALNVSEGTVVDSSGDCFAYEGYSITSLGNNLIGNATNCRITVVDSDLIGTDEDPVDPLLGSIEVIDEYHLTYPLLAGSPAINAGNSASCLETDQIGQSRVGNCDIGAIESLCGDGILQEDQEECDDGNESDSDGCSSTCKVEDSSESAASDESNDILDADDATTDDGSSNASPSAGGCQLNSKIDGVNSKSNLLVLVLVLLITVLLSKRARVNPVQKR